MLVLSLRLGLSVLVLFGLTAAPAPSRAETYNEFLHTDIRTADASFLTPVAGDATECLVTSYDVRVIDDQRFRLKAGPGKPLSGSFSASGISILEYNTCAFEITKYYECSRIHTAGISVSASLDKASLDTALTCFDPYDFEFPTFEVEVHITWAATEPLVRRFRHDRRTGFGEKIFTRLNAAARQAVATGSIVLNGENLIPDASESAVIAAESQARHLLLNCKRNPESCRAPE